MCCNGNQKLPHLARYLRITLSKALVCKLFDYLRSLKKNKAPVTSELDFVLCQLLNNCYKNI
jgi:hypothetical protein